MAADEADVPIYAKIDVALARDPKMIKAGPLARLLYIQATLYCREDLTDGFIDQALLSYIAGDIPTPGKHVGRLVEVGLLEVVPDGWRIPESAWRRWNPLKSEVEEMRRAEAERKQSYRDNRRRDGDVPVGHSRTPTTRDAGVQHVEGEGETEGQLLAPPEATPRPRRVDPLFDALVEACDIKPAELTQSARGALNRALKDLRSVGATPEEIMVRSGRYTDRYQIASLTPTALAKHWPQLAEDRKATVTPFDRLVKGKGQS